MMSETPHEVIWDYACHEWAKAQAAHRAPQREPSYEHSAFVLDTPYVKLIMRDANGTVLATQTQPAESEPAKGAFEVDGALMEHTQAG